MGHATATDTISVTHSAYAQDAFRPRVLDLATAGPSSNDGPADISCSPDMAPDADVSKTAAAALSAQ